MTSGQGQPANLEVVRAALRRGLASAMKARETDAVAAFRIAIAAIDNAEAIDAPEAAPAGTSAHVAGACAGLGAAEAPRRTLSETDVRAILRGLINEYTLEASRYEAQGQAVAANRLRHQAEVLQRATFMGRSVIDG